MQSKEDISNSIGADLENVITSELNKNYVNNEYKKNFAKRDKIDPHTANGWYIQTMASYKLLLDNENLCELDCIITNLKAELFEKQQNAKDYCALEAKFRQLQNEIHLLSDQKICLEHSFIFHFP